MGQIRDYQLEYLYKGTEQINYKVFDSEGTYTDTIDEDVLFSCPDSLVPLDRSLVKLYEKPLLETRFITELASIFYKTDNGQFLYGDDGWELGVTFGNHTAPEVVDATDLNVKPLSGDKYLKAVGSGVSDFMIRSKLSETTLRQGVPLEIGFSYHVEDFNNVLSGKYRYDLSVQIDVTNSGSVNYEYNFDDNKWQTTSGSPSKYQIINDVTGKWFGFKKTLEPFSFANHNNDVNLRVTLTYPDNLESTDVTYIDNFIIAEKIEFNFNKIANVRSRFSYDGGFTGKYESSNILSNELKNDNNFLGQIEGEYQRPRDSVAKTLEAIITQEIINDSRDFLAKYEGTFRNIDTKNLGLHNKIWIDFGVDTLQEPVSAYIDSMTFSVKNAEYRINMHIPNQDDDVDSIYKSIAE